ncbi:hypothetical protein AUO94_15060 [Planococcus kocurii]|uniref:Uncharacterized protein n=1 Tax=Planococcus kocurii TaxID=1374 RepID=A0ABM5WZZ2_9BACL|nr:hypothetical protein AUO94_15060 [Planococcus kocurii]
MRKGKCPFPSAILNLNQETKTVHFCKMKIPIPALQKGPFYVKFEDDFPKGQHGKVLMDVLFEQITQN